MSSFTEILVPRAPYDSDKDERFIRLMRMIHQSIMDVDVGYLREEIFNSIDDERVDGELMDALIEKAFLVEEWDHPVKDGGEDGKLVDGYINDLGNLAASFLHGPEEAADTPKITMH